VASVVSPLDQLTVWTAARGAAAALSWSVPVASSVRAGALTVMRETGVSAATGFRAAVEAGWPTRMPWVDPSATPFGAEAAGTAMPAATMATRNIGSARTMVLSRAAGRAGLCEA
jgi:hypothetical protein